jgi:hypothetical protein
MDPYSELLHMVSGLAAVYRPHPGVLKRRPYR